MDSSLYLLRFVLSSCFHLIILTNFFSSAQPLCHEDESSALLQFKHNFVIDNRVSSNANAYPKVESWKLINGNASDCCSWDGVECDRDTGHVIGLDLSSSFLSGSISSNSSLFNLVHLRRLNLADNHFNYSQIPTPMGSLSRLKSLNLSDSTFSGQIPLEISSLSKLAFLDLSQNVDIYSHHPLLKLENLSLRDLVQNLTNLKVLNLRQVNISSSVPSILSNISSLTYLNLRGCLLNGEFPVSIFFLPNLQQLRISDNEDLTGYLPEFHHRSPLEWLGVGQTSFSGALPSTIGNIESLKVLYLSRCKFSGTIPASFCNLTKLSMLDLSGNMLQGSLLVPPPPIIGYSVARNLLTGEISPSICHCSYLSMLDLSYNNLNGSIPQCLASSIKGLLVLDLHSNNFNGIVPEKFTTGIKVIDLSENQLHGQVPPSLANCAMLQILVLGNNHIKGTFPYWLGALPDLQVLILRSNEFHGAIENLETNLTFPKLRIIDLSYNRFSGELPSNYFKNWNAMKMVKLGELKYMQANVSVKGSEFVYSYTMTIAQKGTLRLYEKIQSAFVGIDLSNNKFSGVLPESLGSLSGIQVLNISNNNLTGTIPSSLASLRELESLDLSRNELSGKIPQQLSQLAFLAVLDVSHNHLAGRIPQGKQFDTFESSSYDGNLGLCGVPLSTPCKYFETRPPPQLNSQRNEVEFPRGIYWMVIFMGYGSGLIVGLVIGTTLTQRYHEWFVEKFGMRKKI